MNYTLVLLTATWITAAPVDAAARHQGPDAACRAGPPANSPPEEATPPEKPSFGTRLHNFFFPPRARAGRPEVPVLEPREVHTVPKLDVPSSPDMVKDTKTAVAPAPATIPAAKSAVVSAPTTVQTAKPAIATTTVQAMRPNFDLAENDLKMVGHETDYSWITGKLVVRAAPAATG